MDPNLQSQNAPRYEQMPNYPPPAGFYPPTEPPPPYTGATSGAPPFKAQPQATNYPMAGAPTTTVAVINVGGWGPYPVQATCPYCGAQMITDTNSTPGLLTYLLSGALVFFGCVLGCCLIPCCIPECQDTEHHCPGCKRYLGTYRRL